MLDVQQNPTRLEKKNHYPSFTHASNPIHVYIAYKFETSFERWNCRTSCISVIFAANYFCTKSYQTIEPKISNRRSHRTSPENSLQNIAVPCSLKRKKKRSSAEDLYRRNLFQWHKERHTRRASIRILQIEIERGIIRDLA